VGGVGYCTLFTHANGKPLVTAGVLAEGDARVAATRILGEDARFDGKGYCFMELGLGEALEVKGEFYATPNPRVVAGAPSADALERKAEFERNRLERWFGPR
jgi:sulfide:quinone oxidoreductase